jgi:peptide/nickel transport system permease protein
MVFGILMGLLAVSFGRVANTVINVLANTVLSVPNLLLLLAIVLAFTPSLFVLTAALGLVHIPHFMRLTYSNARSQMARDYVVSARVLGAGPGRLILKEVLPNTALTLISYAVVLLPAVIVAEGSLSFLGFGVPPPTPSWGGMIAQGAPNLTVAPAPALIPCGALFLTVFCLNTLGDHLRVRLDVREGQPS